MILNGSLLAICLPSKSSSSAFVDPSFLDYAFRSFCFFMSNIIL